MKTHRKPKSLIKALKYVAREQYGFTPTHIASNKTKYVRSREKRRWKADRELNQTTK